MTPAQRKALEEIGAKGELAVALINARTFGVLRLSGWIEDCVRMYFGPRSHRVKLTPQGKAILARLRRSSPPSREDKKESNG